MAAKKALWKNFLLSNPDFEVSNNYLAKIKDLASQSHPFTSMFEEISKNHGIAMISLDLTESSIQLFHHNQVIGGNWENPSKLFVSICGFNQSFGLSSSDSQKIRQIDQSKSSLLCRSNGLCYSRVAWRRHEDFSESRIPLHEHHPYSTYSDENLPILNRLYPGLCSKSILWNDVRTWLENAKFKWYVKQ